MALFFLPAHSHSMNHTHSVSIDNKSLTGQFAGVCQKGTINGVFSLNGDDGEHYNYNTSGRHTPHSIKMDATHNHTGSISEYKGSTGNSKGTSAAFSILPPYVIKYCFERIS